jgi:hypothetical protein
MADISVEGQESVQTDPVSSFSFEGLHEKAMAFGSDTPAADAAVEQVAEPVADAPVVEASETPNIDSANAAQLAQLSDDQLVEITVDGQPVQMSWKDAKGGFQRQAHYTKSMQQFRQEQTQFETERQNLQKAAEEREVLRQLLTTPELLQQYLARNPSLVQQQAALQQAAAQADPDDIATVGQIQSAQQELLRQQEAMQQKFIEELAQREEALTQRIEDRQVTAKLSTDINTTIKGLFNEHPYLQKVIPNADQLLRYEVLQLQPTTPAETLEAFKTVFGGWVENFKSTVAEANKQSVVQKHKLTSNNIQPPGGAPPQQTPTNYKKVNPMTGKTEVDWEALRNVGLSMLK